MKSAPKRTRLRLDALTGNPKNYNTHPQSQVDALRLSLNRYGQPRPILVRAANKQIIAGHGLFAAMKAAGETDVDVLLWDVDQKTADEYLLADNHLAELGRPDDALLAELLRDIDADAYGAIGYADDEVEALLQEKGDDLTIREIETDAVGDTCWVNIVAPLAQQAHVLKRLQELMAELPGVTIELGTTPG